MSRALEGYESEEEEGMPFSVSLLILPLSLHKETRESFLAGSRSYFAKIIETNPQILVGFSDRAKGLMPYSLEALGYLMNYGAISVTDSGNIKLVPKGVRKTITGTDESKACQSVAKTIGKKLAVINDRVTIYTSLGVRP